MATKRGQLIAVVVAFLLAPLALTAQQSPVWHFINGVPHLNSSVVLGPISPTADNTNDLGSSSSRWKDLWLGGALNWSDASLSRGDANRIDGGANDSIRLPGGNITATDFATIGTAGYFLINGRGELSASADGAWKFADANSTGSLTHQFNDNPTCATNCGTSPTLSGVDSSFTLTMGATGSPASGFVVTFNSAWAAAPQCAGSMAKAGMVVGKLPLTIVTTPTEMTVVTNGTAPANGDMYSFRCSLGQ